MLSVTLDAPFASLKSFSHLIEGASQKTNFSLIFVQTRREHLNCHL